MMYDYYDVVLNDDEIQHSQGVYNKAHLKGMFLNIIYVVLKTQELLHDYIYA